MRSTFAGLNTMVLGLYAQQLAQDTAGHNISNANTDGYSRQRANIITSYPQTVYTGNGGSAQVGTGALVESVTRARDSFVDRQYWKENASLGYYESTSSNLSKIEGILKEPNDTGIQTTLNSFWSAWQSLGTNSSDTGMRIVVRQRGEELVNAIKHAEQQLKDLVTDTNSVVEIKTNKINELAKQISDLNRQIANVEAGGKDHANDLRDTRDYLTDQLSKITRVLVTEDNSGKYIIQASGYTLVNETGYKQLETYDTVDPDFGYVTKNIRTADGKTMFEPSDGELKGLIESRDSEKSGVKGYLNSLNSISQFLLTEFNDQHLKAYGLDNNNGTNFFGDPKTYYTNDATNLAAVQANYPNMTTVYGLRATGANSVQPTPQNNWLDQLKVNPVLFNETTGLDKIAAKTAKVPNAGPISVQQSNKNGGAASYMGSDYASAASRTYTIKITKVDTATGAITGATFTTDGGTTPTIATITAGSPTIITLSDNTKISIVNSTGNKIDDTYTFSINQGNAAGDNAVNMANMLKKTPSTLLGTTLDSFYSGMMGNLGVQSQVATNMSDNQTALIGQITNYRESVSGINNDEEMSNMIRFQKGYNAAARMLTTMDEMLDKLINGTGVVGR